MSAVFTGNGLGLFNTSLTQLGGGLGGQARVGQGGEQQYVNLATGNLVWQGQDEHLTFRGLTVGLGRTYNSLGQFSEVGSDGWLTGFERRISLLSGTFNTAGSIMRRHTGDGSYQDFLYVAPNEYRSIAGAGAHDTLSWSGSDWRYVEGSTRQQETYADHADAGLQGRLTGIRNLLSDGVTPAGWEVVYVDGRIIEIRAEGTGVDGEALVFTYDGDGRLEAVSTRENGGLKHQVSYGYDQQGRLTHIVTDLTPGIGQDNAWDPDDDVQQASYDGRLFRTEYSYIGTGLQLASVRQSDGTLVSFTYHADGRLSTVTRGDTNTNDGDGVGETTSYTYGAGSATVTDSLGRSWVYALDALGQLTSLTAPPIDGLSDVTSYQYDADGNVLQIITMRGAQLLAQMDYTYDAAGNVTWEWETTSQWGDQSNAIHRTWSDTNQLLSLTQYTGIDPDGLGSELPTGGMTTRYVYDNQDRLRFVIDALGQVSESTYAVGGNGIGQLASQRQYLGSLYTGAYDETSLQSWATSARRANSMLVELGYDLGGRLAQRTSYAAVDSTGQGVLDDAAELVRYSYNAQGLLLHQITVRGGARTVSGQEPAVSSQRVDYVYDGMDRVLSAIARTVGGDGDDPSTLHTSYTYLDSGQQVAVLDDAGKTTIQTRNSAGRLISLVQRGTVNGVLQQRMQQNYYDAAGQLRASEDAAGGRTYFFYDVKGRIHATVDATGAVTRNTYDGADRLVETYRYSELVTTTAWLVNGQIIPISFADVAAVEDPLLDRITTRSYDPAGRLERLVEGRDGTTEQSITHYYYDGAGRLEQTTVVGGLDPSERSTRYLYDAAGRQVGVLDAGFYLTESIYDAAGRVIEQVRYATRPDWETWATGSLDELRPQGDADNDQRVRHFYDGRGFRQATVDAEGYLTEWVNDEAGNMRAERRYQEQLVWSQGDTVASLRSRAGSHREQRTTYNALGQLLTQTNVEGTVTRYEYDEAGRLVQTRYADATSDIREGHLRYNVFGELIGELSGEGALEVLPGMSEAQLDAIYAQHGVRHRYDAMGRRIESIDSAGNKTWYFYDAAGRQAYVVRGAFDPDGDGSNVQNSLGEVTELRYSAFGEVVERVGYADRVFLEVPGDRDSARQALEALLLFEGLNHQYVYNSRGQLARDISASGNTVAYDYDAFGQVMRQTTAAGSTDESVSEFSYDNLGNLIETVDAVGAREEERSRSWYYDAFGRAISSLDYNGGWNTYAYDRLGRQLVVTQAVAGRDLVTTSTYDAYDRVLSVVDANGGVTQYGYDDATRSTTVTSPEGVVTTTTRNRHGQTVRATTPIGYTEYGYNASGQLLTTDIRANDGALVLSQSQEHDAARGLLTATVDGSGRRVELSYDAVGRVLARVVDPDGAALTTRYIYDGQGRVTTVIDASGRETWHSYDNDGRLIETIQDPNDLRLTTQYAYDTAGRQIRVTEAADSTAITITEYQFDLLGRRVAETVDVEGLQLRTSYEYDANGNVVARNAPDGTTTSYYYDEANQLTHQIDTLGAVTRYWYDRLGRQVASRSFSETISWDALPDGANYYDLDQLLAPQASDMGDYRVYDADGHLRFTASLGGSVNEYAYDAAGRLVASRSFANAFVPEGSLAWMLRDGSVDISQLDTSFLIDDANDQRQFRVYDAAGQVRYLIDAMGQVTETSYDPSGQMTGTIRYANAISMSGSLRTALESGTASVSDVAGALTPAGNDQRALTLFDGAGRAAFSIDAAGVVVQRSFDGAGRVIQTRRYAQPIELISTLVDSVLDGSLTATSLGALLTADASRDRIQSSIYDGAGREVLRLDESGFLRELRYDDMGRLKVERVYSQSVYMYQDPHGAVVSGQMDQYNYQGYLYGLSEATYRASYHYYDGAGRRTMTIDTAAVGIYYEYLAVEPVAGVVTTWTYDGNGRVTSQSTFGRTLGNISNEGELADTDPQWLLDEVAHSWNGPAPRRDTVYRYDDAGRLEYTVTSDFSMVRNHYNALGQLTQVTNYGVLNASPETPFFIWSMSGTEMQSLQGIEAPRTTSYVYDAAGRRTEEVDALGNSAYYSYDAIGRLLSYQNRLGHVWSYDYDNVGRQIAEISPQVEVSTADAAGLVTTQQRSIVTRTSYDSFGNVITRTEDADSVHPRTTSYEYDVRGNQIRTVFPEPGWIDENGNLVTYGGYNPSIEVIYDAWGRAIAQQDVRGNYSYKVYDTQDRVVFDIDQEGFVTEYQYNTHGEQTRLRRLAHRAEVMPTGQSAQEFAGLLTYSDSQDRIIDTFYDSAGRKSSVIQLLWDTRLGDGGGWTYGATVQYIYNGFGELVVERSLATNTRSWGAESPEDEILPSSYEGEHALDYWSYSYHDTHHYYDAVGREVMTVDPAGYLTTRTYDAAGELYEVIEHARAVEWVPGNPSDSPEAPLAGDASTGYDRTTRYSYDALGRRISETQVRHYRDTAGAEFNRNFVSWIGYDAEGRITSKDVDGVETQTEYDALGRVISVEEAERDVLAADAATQILLGGDLASLYERASPYTSMVYDAFGNLVQTRRYALGMHDGVLIDSEKDTLHTFRYDFQGRAIWEKDAVGTEYTRTYDAADNLEQTTYRMCKPTSRSLAVGDHPWPAASPKPTSIPPPMNWSLPANGPPWIAFARTWVPARRTPSRGGWKRGGGAWHHVCMPTVLSKRYLSCQRR
jgi:YD repeat-containing protein